MLYADRQAFFEKLALSLPPQPAIKIGPAPMPSGEHKQGLRIARKAVPAQRLSTSHVRSLMANHLTDVASSEQHTVKPWLDTKLDFAATVLDLSGDGFPLIGGRLDYLDNHSVAALVYQKRKHFINLFIWPAAPKDGSAQTMVEREGYHLVHWSDGDFTYWAVSDVNINDLQSFKQLFEQQTARH
jgi:anti-sigma factor RsiW